jgi:hypothetical protein
MMSVSSVARRDSEGLRNDDDDDDDIAG